MSFVADFDAWLIAEKFEPFSWRIEYRFGKDCFWLAKAASLAVIILYVVLFYCFKYVILSPEQIRIFGPMFNTSFVLISAFILYVLLYVGISITATQVRGNPTVMNPAKERVLITRTFISALATIEAFPKGHGVMVDLMYFFLGLSAVALLYFWACNPMPPGWKPKEKVPNAVPQGT